MVELHCLMVVFANIDVVGASPGHLYADDTQLALCFNLWTFILISVYDVTAARLVRWSPSPLCLTCAAFLISSTCFSSVICVAI